MMSITKNKRRVFDFIRGYMDSNQQAPTIREIGSYFNLKSPAHVHKILVALESDGLIKRSRSWRGIQIVQQVTSTAGVSR